MRQGFPGESGRQGRNQWALLWNSLMDTREGLSMLDLGEAGNRARQRVKIQDRELVITGSEDPREF